LPRRGAGDEAALAPSGVGRTGTAAATTAAPAA